MIARVLFCVNLTYALEIISLVRRGDGVKDFHHDNLPLTSILSPRGRGSIYFPRPRGERARVRGGRVSFINVKTPYIYDGVYNFFTYPELIER